jgi:hypothetical protein
VTLTVKKIALLIIAVLVGLAVLTTAVFMYRLSRGPVALTFLTGTIQRAINTNLAGYRVELADAIVELDSESRQPRLRLRNVILLNGAGEPIARAPKAAIGISGMNALFGDFAPRQLELIGARILALRQIDGVFRLGFIDTSSTASSPGPRSGSGSAADNDQLAPALPGQASQLREFLERELLRSGSGNTAVSTLEAVKISNASIQLHDEINQADWHAPSANLVFKRMPYGFALVASMKIATGSGSWRSELVANYRAASRTFSVSARVFDLIPAELSDKIFALHKLAQARIPLSGKAEFEITDGGKLTKASAELAAAGGLIGFPDYVAEPIAIKEGLLRFDWDPATSAVVLADSTITTLSGTALLNGRVDPQRHTNGRLTGLRVALDVQDLSMSSGVDDAGAVAFDNIKLEGVASIDESRFDIEDLVLYSGDAAVRVRGSFAAEGEAMAVRLGGVMRQLPARFVKRLWPPVVAPGTRKWFATNVIKGVVTEGSFRIDLPGNIVAQAMKGKPIPNEQVDLRFSMDGFETRYFGDLPPVANARGKGRLQGNLFELTLDAGIITVPSGGIVALSNGRLETRDLTAQLSPGTIQVEASARANHVLELIDQNPLKYATRTGIEPDQMGGNAKVVAKFEIPFIKRQKPKVTMTAEAVVEDISLKGMFNQADVDGGGMTFSYTGGMVAGNGTVRLNSVPASIQWSRTVGKGVVGHDQLLIEADLDDHERKRLGLDMGGFVRGRARIRLAGENIRGKLARAHVEANLANSELRIDAIRWRRPPGSQATASFDIDFTDSERKTIDKLKVEGSGLSVAGTMVLGKAGEILSADFPKVALDDQNRFALKVRRDNGVIHATITGRIFDARNLISGLFSNSGPPSSDEAKTPVRVEARFDRVHAHRGEELTQVVGSFAVSRSFVQQADVKGLFSSGAPATLRITPDAAGNRELRIACRDGGAALRAANLYSKVSGGQLDFAAGLGAVGDSSVRRGQLVIRNFEVRNEDAVRDFDQTGKSPRRSATRTNRLAFTKFTMPFSTDRNFVRIGDSLIQGVELGASAQGVIRKQDGALDIGGTVIPAYSINSALGEFPIIGDLLTGGKGQGVFGMNYALRGTMADPQLVVNPVSALAPGIFRHIFPAGAPVPGGKPAPPRKDSKDSN